MSLSVPFRWTQFHAWQSFTDSARRLAVGFAAMSSRMNSTSASVINRPRYFNLTSMPASLPWRTLERKSGVKIFSQVSEIARGYLDHRLPHPSLSRYRSAQGCLAHSTRSIDF